MAHAHRDMPRDGRHLPCVLPGCSPGGPGIIAQGSPTVTVGGRPVARLGDPTQHPTCIAPIPGPTGKVIGPGCPTVLIG